MPEVKDFVMLFSNLAGLAMMAWAIFVLHRDSIKEFTSQLREERNANLQRMEHTEQNNTQLWKSYMELKIRQHEQVIGALVAQDKTLDHLSDAQGRILDEVRFLSQNRAGRPGEERREQKT